MHPLAFYPLEHFLNQTSLGPTDRLKLYCIDQLLQLLTMASGASAHRFTGRTQAAQSMKIPLININTHNISILSL